MLYLITEDVLKKESIITKNVEISDLNPIIKACFNVNLCQKFGLFFIENLNDKYNLEASGTPTLTAKEIKLIEKLQLCMAWYITSNAVWSLSFQVKNKGVQKQRGEYSDAVDSKEIKTQQDQTANIGEAYENLAFSFICKNIADFSDFESDQNEPMTKCKSCNDKNQTQSNFIVL